MNKYLSILKSICSPTVLSAIALGIVAAVVPEMVVAQFYNGPGIVGGINHANAVGGVSGGSIRSIVLEILLAVLLFMGLAAVVVIVIAGIMLVLSFGDDAAKEKAKKIILYAIIGLIVIAIAAGIVTIIIEATGGTTIFGPVPDIGATGGTSIRDTIVNILDVVLGFMALLAVVAIVIAGIYMVVSLGDEQAKDRAKKIILYVVIGLLIILFAQAIVGFVKELST